MAVIREGRSAGVLVSVNAMLFASPARVGLK